jgi:hypothetical protein
MRRTLSMPGALIMASVSIVIGMAPVGASAAGFDGSANLICAANNVVACTKSSICVQGEASTFDLPIFMYVDFKGKVVKARTEGDAKQVESPIRNFQKSNTQLILQGIENGHGWGISIDQGGGRMTTTVSGESSSFMIFGACTAIQGVK